MMSDLEKTIKGLEEISDYFFSVYHHSKDREEINKSKDRCDAVEDAISMLKEQEAQKWNLLTEDADGIIHGLPGDDGQYLMTDGKDIWIDDYVDGVDDGIFLDSGRDLREIKAWMYMPELPKQEGR